MGSFSFSTERDAYATIRGYVYQVDITIERWLNLQTGQVLELECGEDIDVVLPALEQDPNTWERIVQQIKHRTTSVTLRSPSALEAIVHFTEHRRNNPNMKLLFQYVTNAPVGQEELSPLTGPAMVAWEQLRIGLLTDSAAEQALLGIKQILQAASRPSGIGEKKWEQFQTWLSALSLDQLLEFVRALEWNTDQPEATDYTSRLRSLLIAKGHASDAPQAQLLYERLFFFVFKLLTLKAQPKRLSEAALAEQLALPTLNDADHAQLGRLTSNLQTLEQRVSAVEHGLAQLVEHVEEISREQSTQAALVSTVPPALDLPTPVSTRSERDEAVKTLQEVMTSHAWTAIYGSAGLGKTQLGLLLTQTYSTCHWLRFQGFEKSRVEQHLIRALTELIGTPPGIDRAAWYQVLGEHLGSNALLVLDDLPALSHRDALAEQLVLLTRVCHSKGIRLLSLSTHKLPSQLTTVLGDALLAERAIPRFSERECADILREYGASATWLDQRSIAFLNTLAQQHPMLITALAKYLKERDWQVTQETLTDLFSGVFTAELNSDTVQTLLETIAEPSNRDFLYRLTLFERPFTAEDMQLLAEIEPKIDRPYERLHLLTGLWVQQSTPLTWILSPLVSTLGKQNLSTELWQACHRVLAKQLLADRTMTIEKTWEALHHLEELGKFDQMGWLVITALNQLGSLDSLAEDYQLLSLWYDVSLPSAMNLGLRLYLRGIQARVRKQRRLPIDPLLQDIATLMQAATPVDAWAILGMLANAPLNASDAYRYLLQVLHWLATGQARSTRFLPSEDLPPIEMLIWLHIHDIADGQQLREWLDVVEQLTDVQRSQAFTNSTAEQGCLLIADAIWQREVDRPVPDRDWRQVLKALHDAAQRARSMNLSLLWVCLTRDQVIVLAEYLQDLTEAATLTSDALITMPDDPRLRFLLQECLGRQYAYTSHAQKAQTWLTQALQEPTSVYPFLRLVAQLTLSRVIGEHDPQGAVVMAKEAATLARESISLPETVIVKALGELAIAQWLTGDKAATFATWEEAADRVFSCRAYREIYPERSGPRTELEQLMTEPIKARWLLKGKLREALLAWDAGEDRTLPSQTETNAWKDLFVVFGHVSGYFAHNAFLGEQEPLLLNGVPYTSPRRGMFFTWSATRHQLYQKNKDAFLYAQLAIFAEGIANDSGLDTWALRGVAFAKAEQQPSVLNSLSQAATSTLLLTERYREVLELAQIAGAVSASAWQQHKSGTGVSLVDLPIEAILGPKPNLRWEMVEFNIFRLAILPIALQLLRIQLEDAERARKAASDIVVLFDDMSRESVNPQAWTVLVALFKDIFEQNVLPGTIINHSKTLDFQNYAPHYAISFLGASVQSRVPPEQAYVWHSTTLPYIKKMLTTAPAVWRRIALPWVSNYWTHKFKQARIRFQVPRIVEEALHEAYLEPPDRQVQSILHAISLGLPENLPQPQWE